MFCYNLTYDYVKAFYITFIFDYTVSGLIKRTIDVSVRKER